MTEKTALPILQRDHRTTRGTIAYLSHKPDRYLQERGREYFHIDVHSDGKRTITAHCEIDDRPSVMRDITYSVDEQWLPMDCFVRITVGDRFMGSGWFKFHEGHTECETFTALEGRVSQRMEHRLVSLAFPVFFKDRFAQHFRRHLLVVGQISRVRKPAVVIHG